MSCLTKVEIARLLNKELNASKGELVQFLHSNFYKEGLNEEQYLHAFKQFVIELDECLLSLKGFSINDTFLKGKSFTTSKIPVKVKKQLELDYIEHQKYLEQDIKEASK
jgi:hypothetical protein